MMLTHLLAIVCRLVIANMEEACMPAKPSVSLELIKASMVEHHCLE